MSYLISEFLEAYRYLMDEIADSRAKRLLFMDGSMSLFIIIAVYLIFVLKWGPNYMKNRTPYNIDKIVIVYNILQIYLCVYLIQKALRLTYGFGDYNILCQPIDYSNSEVAVTILEGVHEYFLMKVFDLLDTVFFVLRKRNRQITFLHVYHHAGMVFCTWIGVKFLGGGNSVLLGLFNCFVHVVMYSYYLISVIKPEFKNILRWKKLVTQLQIIQFVLILAHELTLLIHPFCGYPKFTAFILIPQNCFLIALFSEFYYKNYCKKQKTDELIDDSISYCEKKKILKDGTDEINEIETEKASEGVVYFGFDLQNA